MNNRVFNIWLETFRSSINEYGYYTDFELVFEKAKEFKVEINILNSLVGSNNIENEFKELIKKYPECINAIPILLAVRNNELYCQDENGGKVYEFKITEDKTINDNLINDYIYFMNKTGLFDLLEKHIISNLFDYVTGVEVGLDSNGRKHRGGVQMEKLVESYIKRTGAEYYKEMYLNDIEDRWDIDLSSISAEGTTTKRWDFVVKTDDKVYLIETNFYTGGGSKLNETARSYKMITEEAKDIDEVEFVWITDGAGWQKHKRNLEETFNVLENLYNIKDMEDNKLEELFK